MRRLRGKVAWIALVLLAGGAGCHLTGGVPADLGEGHGRVDRTFATNLGTAIQATLGALDDLEVRPKGGTVRANDAVSDLGKPGWASATNTEFFRDDQSYRDLFERQLLSIKGADPIHFAPILMTYKGEAKDGRVVSVVIRSQPPDATQTLIMTRLGRDGDEAWSQQLLGRVGDRLNLLPQQAPNPAATPTAPTAAPAVPASPADPSLPALPPSAGSR